jgi:hypothetical protein
MKSGILGNDLAVLQTLGCFDKRVNGAGTVSAIGAIYLASRNAPRPMSGLVRAAFMKNADTDTMASMTAGLLGALHGSDWLGPLASSIQDRAYLEDLADRCTMLALGERRESDPDPKPVRDRDLMRFRDALTRGPVATIPSGRKIRDIQIRDLESRNNGHARRWVLHVDSQTMTIDLVDRGLNSTHTRPKMRPWSRTRDSASCAACRCSRATSTRSRTSTARTAWACISADQVPTRSTTGTYSGSSGPLRAARRQGDRSCSTSRSTTSIRP